MTDAQFMQIKRKRTGQFEEFIRRVGGSEAEEDEAAINFNNTADNLVSFNAPFVAEQQQQQQRHKRHKCNGPLTMGR